MVKICRENAEIWGSGRLRGLILSLDCVDEHVMSAQTRVKRETWNMEQQRRTLGSSNHIRKTVDSMRTRLLNKTGLTPLPKLRPGSDSEVMSTTAVVDFPKLIQPTEGGLFPLTSKDLAASCHNETEIQLQSYKFDARFDVNVERHRWTEKLFTTSLDSTIDELTEDVAIFLRLLQDVPLKNDEDLLVVSLVPKGTYLSAPRGSVSTDSVDIREKSEEPEFMGENYVLAMRNNVTDKDIENAVMVNVDDLAKLNGVPFPDDTAFQLARTARARFRTQILAHTVANLKQKRLGCNKKLLQIQPDGATKVKFMNGKV